MNFLFPSITSSLKVKNSNTFFNFKVQDYEYLLKTKNEDYWQNLGQKRSLELFHQVALRVPAYKDFLKKHKVNAAKIKTFKDFSLLPQTDKSNYIQAYPLKSRCFDGQIFNSTIIASSSGTTGTGNYWPRNSYQEFEAALTHELLFKNLYHIDQFKTLFIIGFPMGVYVSGMATVLPSWLVVQKYNASIVSCGNNKTEVLKAVNALGRDFEQIVMVGHPFFIKDVLESGVKLGIVWKNYRVGLMFCSEGFNEEWREHILSEAGLRTASAFNTYGSSEMLLMAYETEQSIASRIKLNSNPALAKELFGNTEIPNLFQYNPALRYIEEEGGEFLFTSQSGLPLVRFNLHDSGKIIKHSKISEKLKLTHRNFWNLPFLALNGRSDYTMIFYAANIYPQHIHSALGKARILKNVSGKFTMTKGYYKNMDEFLEINIELKPKLKPNQNLKKIIGDSIVKKLLEINSEYNYVYNNLHKDLKPKIKLWPYQHKKYFTPGLKPRYIA